MARIYELTDKGRGMEMKNQQKLVHGALLDGPRTAEQIAEAIKSQLVTRQAPVKVAQFYLSVWKKDGIVRVSNEAAVSSQDPANVEKTAEPQEVAQLTESTPVSDGNDSQSVDTAATEMTNESAPIEQSAIPMLQQREDETLMSFVFRLVQSKPEGIWPTDIEEITSGAIRKKQAQDTLRRLQGHGNVAKSDAGYRAVSNNPYTE